MRIFFIILILLILFPAKELYSGGIQPGPLLRISYDYNLGLSYGLGVAIIKFDGGIGQGPYFLYSYSREKESYNFSLGHFAGVGFASFRYGVNYMITDNENGQDTYWGAEFSPNFFLLNLQGGVMYSRNSRSFRPNLAFGWGIF